MKSHSMEVHNSSPVLILAYNRPEMLKELLLSLPLDRKVYIHLDGAKDKNDYSAIETKRVAEVYSLSHQYQSIRLLSQERNIGNLGSFRAAMSWVFSFENRIILLEDDIRVSSTFFPYMDWALEKYMHSSHIFQINGLSMLNFLPGRNRLFESYSCKPWGFGTWKNRWNLYLNTKPVCNENEIFSLPIFKGVNLTETFKAKWLDRFVRLHQGTDTYDLGWNYAAWAHNARALAPRFSFVTNIGFDSRALHTRNRPYFLPLMSSLKHQSLNFSGGKTVPFPSYYDAFSDFLEWGTPGINKGSTFFFIRIYQFLRSLKYFLIRIFSVVSKLRFK